MRAPGPDGELALAHGIASLLPPLLLSVRGRDAHCVLAASCAIELAERFGIDAAPVPVRIIVGNASFGRAWRDYSRDGVKPRETDDLHFVHARALWPNRTPPGRWGGHLLARVGERTLVDPSAGLFSRPERGIELPDGVAIDMGSGAELDSWLRGERGSLNQPFDSPHGQTIMSISHDPENLGYQVGADWRDRQHVAAADLLAPRLWQWCEALTPGAFRRPDAQPEVR